MVFRIKRHAEKDEENIKDKVKDVGEKMDVAVHKIKDLNKSATREFKELGKKWDDIYDRYDLEKRGEELEAALQDLDKFIKKHPHAGVALGAAAGYIVGSLFSRK
ncbi:MAG: hypothetical protein ABH950_06045 [Candidatus Altiarchaeota archaeon]